MKEILHSTKYLNLVRDGTWVYASRPSISGVVCIAGLTENDEVVLVEQFRIPVGARVIEFPAGLAGDVADQEEESLVDAAKRELVEETGYEPSEIYEAFRGPSSAGLADEVITFLVARGLKKVSAGGGDENEEITVHVISKASVWAFLKSQMESGVLVDSRVPTCLWLLDNV
jgi:ADP-ribose pyrophosphatase